MRAVERPCAGRGWPDLHRTTPWRGDCATAHSGSPGRVPSQEAQCLSVGHGLLSRPIAERTVWIVRAGSQARAWRSTPVIRYRGKRRAKAGSFPSGLPMGRGRWGEGYISRDPPKELKGPRTRFNFLIAGGKLRVHKIVQRQGGGKA